VPRFDVPARAFDGVFAREADITNAAPHDAVAGMLPADDQQRVRLVSDFGFGLKH
jgi:hypothetical protein